MAMSLSVPAWVLIVIDPVINFVAALNMAIAVRLLINDVNEVATTSIVILACSRRRGVPNSA